MAMMQRTFSPRMFPHFVVLWPSGYIKGQTGGAVRSDVGGIVWPANVQLAADDKLEREYPDEGRAAGSVTTYNVSLPPTYQGWPLPSVPGASAPTLGQALPAIKTDDSITQVSAAGLPLFTIIANGPAASALRGACYRTRGVSRA
jgi:hypothetical protein